MCPSQTACSSLTSLCLPHTRTRCCPWLTSACPLCSLFPTRLVSFSFLLPSQLSVSEGRALSSPDRMAGSSLHGQLLLRVPALLSGVYTLVTVVFPTPCYHGVFLLLLVSRTVLVPVCFSGAHAAPWPSSGCHTHRVLPLGTCLYCCSSSTSLLGSVRGISSLVWPVAHGYWVADAHLHLPSICWLHLALFSVSLPMSPSECFSM